MVNPTLSLADAPCDEDEPDVAAASAGEGEAAEHGDTGGQGAVSRSSRTVTDLGEEPAFSSGIQQEEAQNVSTSLNPTEEARKQEAEHKSMGRAFVNQPGFLDDLFRNSQLLNFQDDLMKEVMKMTGQRWEMRQYAKVLAHEPRQFKVTEFGRGTAFKAYAKKLLCSWRCGDRWYYHTRTPSTASILFRAYSRSGAVNYELNTVRCRRWPTPLFNMVYDPVETVEKLKAANACELDSFTLGVRNHYSQTEARLDDPDLRAEVTLLAHEADPISLSTERLHSIARRHVKRRQTTSISLSLLSAFQTLRSRSRISVDAKKASAVFQKKRQRESRDDEFRRPDKRFRRSAAGVVGDRQELQGSAVLKKPAAARQRSGGGGSHRAFIAHAAASGLIHEPDQRLRFKLMNEAYRPLG